MSSDWVDMKIKELGRVITGKTPSTKVKSYFGSKYPFITPSDLNFSSSLPLYDRALSEEGYLKQKNQLLPPNSVCYTSIGATIGKMCITKKPSFTNQQINSIIVNESNDYRFVYFLLKFNNERIKVTASGAATPLINKTTFSDIIVTVPPLKTQYKIAGVLSAYDDLMENNTHRIAILEEMAQRIYKEWFVDFKYPGHENDKLVDSELGMIPEGWEVKTLNDILEILESGSRPKGGIDPAERDIPSIGAENVLGLGKYDYSKEKYINREFFENMRRGHIKSNDVLLYKDGAKLGRKTMFKDGFPHIECCINEHVFILRTNQLCSQSYLYFWLDLQKMTRDIINLNSNAAQPGINQKGVKGLTILIADTTIMEKFEIVVNPILTELFCLSKKDNNLRKTRDLLLPKLISGKVDVSELDINIGES